MSKYSSGLFRPYLQPMSGLGQQGRNRLAIVYGGPRGGAGSAIRVYNYYTSLPEPFRTNYLKNLKKKASIYSGGSLDFGWLSSNRALF